MTEQVLWTAENLSMTIGKQTLYDGTACSIREGERVALIGRNGTGKSTLLKIAAGLETPSPESILTRKRGLRVAMLPQICELDPARTIRENVADGLAWFRELQEKFESVPIHSAEYESLEKEIRLHDAWNLEKKLSSVLTGTGLLDHADRSAADLSGGEKRLAAFARAIVSEPDLLLLDEPTNHLDVETIEWIENYLAACRASCLFVTHDRYFLDRIATRILELSHGKIYSYDGSYADYLAEKEAREYREDVFEQKRRHFLRSEIEWVRRSPKARLRRNLGRLRHYEEVAAIAAPERDSDMELVIPPPGHLGNRVVTFKDVTFSFGDRTIIRDFSFDFEPGSRIGLIGPNGIGKTTLVKLISGQLKPDAGTIAIADTVFFNRIDQQRMLLDPEKTVQEEIGEGREYVLFGSEKITIWTYLKRFLFEDERIRTQIKHLSGGEKARLALAKVLKTGGNFLLLDEPTNDLDLSSLRLLEEALSTFGGCILAVSHDRYFLNRICTGILSFEENGIIRYTPGDYDYAMEKRRMRLENAKPASPTPTARKTAEPPVREKVKTKLSFREQQELDGMENAITALETRISEIESMFCDPDFFARHGSESTALQQELEQAKAECETRYARWQELEELKEKYASRK